MTFRTTATAGTPLLATALVALAVGCSSTPPPRFYQLSRPTIPSRASTTNRLDLVIRSVRIPDYLKRNQIVTRADGNRMEVSEFHRWIEPLDATLTRSTAIGLQRLLPDARITVYPTPADDPTYALLEITVLSFEGILNEWATLEAGWALIDPDTNVVLIRGGERLQRGVKDDSYEALVASMSELYAEFVVTISRAVATYGPETEKTEP